MRYEMPTFFHEMRDMAAIRKSINACIREPHSRAVTALIRIRYEQHEARPVDSPTIRIVAVVVPIVLLLGAMTRPSVATFALVGIGSAGWWLMLSYYNSRYPHRDEIDIPERQRIDEMVRLALESNCEARDLSDLRLNNAEKKQILELFAQDPLPTPLRKVVSHQSEPESLPDV